MAKCGLAMQALHHSLATRHTALSAANSLHCSVARGRYAWAKHGVHDAGNWCCLPTVTLAVECTPAHRIKPTQSKHGYDCFCCFCCAWKAASLACIACKSRHAAATAHCHKSLLTSLSSGAAHSQEQCASLQRKPLMATGASHGMILYQVAEHAVTLVAAT